MSFANAIKSCFSKYVDFKGTASRSEYWFFALFLFLAFILLSVSRSPAVVGLGYLAVLLPSLAVQARRLRDGGFSPWLMFLALVPFLGSLALLIMCCMPSKTGAAGGISTYQPGAVNTNDAQSFCPSCGKLRLPGQNFCQGCGHAF
jgi:uncharacterized membrane protein YhaH (DUF805 family)